MREIFVHRYTLRSPARGNRHSDRREFPGALVKIGNGYGCVHPWPELGDLPLDEQLGILADGEKLTPLLERTLACAQLDGDARERGENLFDGLEIPASHWLWNVGIETERQLRSVIGGGFLAIKVKCDGSQNDARLLAEISSKVPGDVLLRPDLNAALRADSFGDWLLGISAEVWERIDFIEDPMPYDAGVWGQQRSEFGIDFALDRASGDLKFGVGVRWRVVKAAVEDPTVIASQSSGAGLIFTSYLDHPLGQLFAAYHAADSSAEVGLCGLASHLWFEGNPFSDALEMGGCGRLLAPEGTGLGFDGLLDGLNWSRL